MSDPLPPPPPNTDPALYAVTGAVKNPRPNQKPIQRRWPWKNDYRNTVGS